MTFHEDSELATSSANMREMPKDSDDVSDETEQGLSDITDSAWKAVDEHEEYGTEKEGNVKKEETTKNVLLEVTIRPAAKEDNESLKQLTKETYTHKQLPKPSLTLECTSPRKLPKFAILGYVVYVFTQSHLWAFLAAFSFLGLRVGWTYLWIWLWPRLMIHDDNLYGGMFEKFRSQGPSACDDDVKTKSNVRRKRSCLLVAEVKGHGVIGCLGVAPGDSFINPTPTFFQKFAIWILDISPPVAEFKRLMVKESFRSHGVATKLLEAAFQFCRTNKYKSVTLSTFLVWHKARKLYAKVGFEESDIQMFDFSFHGKNLVTGRQETSRN